MNAIVHGNLGIGSAMREDDLGGYGELIGTRRGQSPYRERRVHVHASASTAETRYVIRDEGMGFDPRVVADPTDPANMEQASGRGMLLIRTFMDEVSHNAEGNEITLVKRRERQESQR
jgi:anti-sigma regulatory factor (Ser/Thr protein kinase)